MKRNSHYAKNKVEMKCLVLLNSINKHLEEIENLKQKESENIGPELARISQIRMKRRQILFRQRELSEILEDLKVCPN